jgi:hypothetical protein
MSNIVFSTINAGFPEAGKDNNSQGFRDNFNIIKNALNTAKTEIGILENNTAKTNDDNDFNGVLIANAEIRRLYNSVSNEGTISGAVTIDTRDADYYYANISGNTTITLSQWPDDGLARTIRVQLKTTSDTTDFDLWFVTSQLSATFYEIGPTWKPYKMGTSLSTWHIFEISTIDGGDTMFVKLIGRFNDV